jgi:hypothetical protein
MKYKRTTEQEAAAAQRLLATRHRKNLVAHNQKKKLRGLRCQRKQAQMTKRNEWLLRLSEKKYERPRSLSISNRGRHFPRGISNFKGSSSARIIINLVCNWPTIALLDLFSIILLWLQARAPKALYNPTWLCVIRCTPLLLHHFGALD